MSRSSRLLPSPRAMSGPWLFVVLLLGGLGLILGVLVLIAHNPNDPLLHVLLFYVVIYGGGPTLAGGILLVLWYFKRQREQEWVERAQAVGLRSIRESVTEDDLGPFLDLPLFCFGEPQRQQAGWLASGVAAGHEMRVMHYRYAGWYRTRRGDRVFHGTTQTVALIPHAGSLPDFHLSPRDTDWDVMAPDWPFDLDVGPVVRVVSGRRSETLIRGDSPAVAQLFTPERLERMGLLGGWTIECQGGRLLIYRHWEVMEADDLPYFVHRAADLASVLLETVGGDQVEGDLRRSAFVQVQPDLLQSWQERREQKRLDGPPPDSRFTARGRPPVNRDRPSSEGPPA